jgi:hypothetical protein
MRETSLRVIADRVRNHIEASHRTTNTAVADAVISQFRQTSNQPIIEENVRRRVCDVISVFKTVGYIQKTENSLIWVGHTDIKGPGPEEIDRVSRRIASKEQLLQYKMKIFLLYSALIGMNRTMRKPQNAVDFPMICIGSRGGQCAIERSGNDGGVLFESRAKPEVFSPIDILMSKPFDEDAVEGARQSLPRAALVDRLIPM